MKFFFSSLFILFSSYIFSQSVFGTLKGDQKPIEFANVLLFKAADTSFVTAGFSDSTGYFFIALPSEADEYFIRAEMLGFENFNSAPFANNKDFKTINLIKDESQNLDEVSITVQKQMFEKTGRGMIVNVDASPVLSAGSAQETLEKIPGVVINVDGSLSL